MNTSIYSLGKDWKLKSSFSKNLGNDFFWKCFTGTTACTKFLWNKSYFGFEDSFVDQSEIPTYMEINVGQEIIVSNGQVIEISNVHYLIRTSFK